MDEAFFRIHSGLDREGPGSPSSTRRALRLAGLGRPSAAAGPQPLRVLDLGCGPGAQTITLAQELPQAHITAVDLHAPFVAETERRAVAAGVGDRVSAVVGDMADVAALVDEPVDLVWSEGAAYTIGFRTALAAWRTVLRPAGHLGLTEPVWAAPTVPREVKDFWTAAYPGMQPVQVRRAQALQSGYRRIGDFPLPATDWEAYYQPLRDRVEGLRDRSEASAGLAAAIAAHDRELAVFEAGGPEVVGYHFFVLRRT